MSSKTALSTGPDDRNRDAEEPSATPDLAHKPGYASSNATPRDQLLARERGNVPPAPADAGIERGHQRDIAYRGDEDLDEPAAPAGQPAAQGAPRSIGAAGTARQVMEAQGLDQAGSVRPDDPGPGDSDRLGTRSGSPGTRVGSASGGQALEGRSSGFGELSGEQGRAGDIGGTGGGGRSDNVGSSDKGARAGTGARPDLRVIPGGAGKNGKKGPGAR